MHQQEFKGVYLIVAKPDMGKPPFKASEGG